MELLINNIFEVQCQIFRDIVTRLSIYTAYSWKFSPIEKFLLLLSPAIMIKIFIPGAHNFLSHVNDKHDGLNEFCVLLLFLCVYEYYRLNTVVYKSNMCSCFFNNGS